MAAAAGFVASVVPGGKLFVKAGTSSTKYAKVVLRHYTSRAYSTAILEEGVLRASKYGKIFAESANRKVLSKADAEQAYGLRTGKGRDIVEFNPMAGQRWETKKNPITVVEEWIVYGDVELGPDSKVLQRVDQ